MQNILPEHTYSIIVAIGSISLFIIGIKTLFWYAIIPGTRKIIDNLNYFTFMKVILALSGSSIIGALIYQNIYNTPVCPLCWQQRMMLYAIAIVSAVSLWKRDRFSHISIAAMSVFGLYIAIPHYYYHYLKYVVNNPLSLPCDAEGIACSESAIGAVFGFVTIPLMSICIFTPILITCYFAWRKSR